MIQNIEHLKEGDLVAVLQGWSHKIEPAVYLKSTFYSKDVPKSIHYLRLDSNVTHWLEHGYYDRITVIHSTTQRIWKITEDNLTKEQLERYQTIKRKICQKKEKTN